MATISISDKRDYIKEVYKNSPGFCHRVDKMSDNQIIAIYFSLLNREGKKNDKKQVKMKIEEPPKYVQIELDI